MSSPTDERPRQRLSREERRAQLLALGMAQVAATSFDELSVEDVAERAGISRGLVFHYFDSRADFAVAIARAAADELFRATDPASDAPPVQRLRAGLEAFLSYVERRAPAYRSLVRGAAGGDERMRQVYEQTQQRIADRTVEELASAGFEADVRARVAVRGWVAFVETVVVAWLDDDPASVASGLSRDELLDLCEQCAWALLLPAATET